MCCFENKSLGTMIISIDGITFKNAKTGVRTEIAIEVL